MSPETALTRLAELSGMERSVSNGRRVAGPTTRGRPLSTYGLGITLMRLTRLRIAFVMPAERLWSQEKRTKACSRA